MQVKYLWIKDKIQFDLLIFFLELLSFLNEHICSHNGTIYMHGAVSTNIQLNICSQSLSSLSYLQQHFITNIEYDTFNTQSNFFKA